MFKVKLREDVVTVYNIRYAREMKQNERYGWEVDAYYFLIYWDGVWQELNSDFFKPVE